MGPLHGVRVIELESLAPAPFGCMMLADLGADVLRVGLPGRAVTRWCSPAATRWPGAAGRSGSI